MTDMRERVARAMQKADAGPICCLPDNEFFNAISAVALKECGYAEMRKALENLRQRTMSDGTPCFCGVETLGPMTMEHYNWCREARSILERTGEK